MGQQCPGGPVCLSQRGRGFPLPDVCPEEAATVFSGAPREHVEGNLRTDVGATDAQPQLLHQKRSWILLARVWLHLPRPVGEGFRLSLPGCQVG